MAVFVPLVLFTVKRPIERKIVIVMSLRAVVPRQSSTDDTRDKNITGETMTKRRNISAPVRNHRGVRRPNAEPQGGNDFPDFKISPTSEKRENDAKNSVCQCLRARPPSALLD